MAADKAFQELGLDAERLQEIGEAADISLAHLKEDITDGPILIALDGRLILGQIVMYIVSVLWMVLPLAGR